MLFKFSDFNRQEIKLSLTLFLVITINLIGRAYLRETNEPSLDEEIEEIITDVGIIGLDISVVKDGKVIFNRVYGDKNIETGQEYQLNDICWIGSVSKTFVATAIMQLYDEGKLNLDDDAQKYLDFPLRNPFFRDTPITIRMLLTHLSSIFDGGPWYSYDFINSNKNPDYQKYFKNYKPGKGYTYCNYNYNILAAIIEGATGERFDNYIREKITTPLDMYGDFNCNNLDSTRFVTVYHYDKSSKKYIDSHVPYKNYKYHLVDNYKLEETTGLLYPAAGMKTSSSELAKYMMMHMQKGHWNNNIILSENSEEEMRKIYPGTQNYGLSFREYKGLVPNKTLVGQTGGGTLGEKTAMIFDPEGKYGFVIITNGSKSNEIDGYGDIHKPLIQVLNKHLIQK